MKIVFVNVPAFHLLRFSLKQTTIKFKDETSSQHLLNCQNMNDFQLNLPGKSVASYLKNSLNTKQNKNRKQ